MEIMKNAALAGMGFILRVSAGRAMTSLESRIFLRLSRVAYPWR